MRYPDPRKTFTPGSMAGAQVSGVQVSGVHSSKIRASRIHAFPKRQRGVVLILTLIVLVAMTLASIALVRSVDTGNVVAGNMAFKQGSAHAGDAGIEAAIGYLRAIVTATGNGFAVDTASEWDIPAEGYYASVPGKDTDMTGNSHDATRPTVDWGKNNCSSVPNSGCLQPSQKITVAGTGNVSAGNEVRYIIQRMCLAQGPLGAGANSCISFFSQSGQSPNRGALDYAHNRRFGLAAMGYFLITARATGPRNTVSYVQTIVHF